MADLEDQKRQLSDLMKRYLSDEAALAACMTVYNLMRCVNLNMSGVVSSEVASLTASSFAEVFMTWPNNPFIARHGAAFTAQVCMSLNAFFDRGRYVDQVLTAKEKNDQSQEARDAAIKAYAMRSEMANVLVLAVALTRGWGRCREESDAIRTAFMTME